MYINSKTAKRQICVQILNAVIIGAAAFVGLAPLALTFRPQAGADRIFIWLDIVMYLFIVCPFSSFVASIAAYIRRRICVSPCHTDKKTVDRILDAAYLAYLIFASAVIGAIIVSLSDTDISVLESLAGLMMSIGLVITIICIPTIIIIEAIQYSHLKKQGIQKPVSEINIYKRPSFIISVIAIIFVLCCIPIQSHKVGYEADTDHYYHRIDAIAYSYISKYQMDTGVKVDGKLVPFPINYMDTDALFGIPKNHYVMNPKAGENNANK